MKLSQLGERKIIEGITRGLRPSASLSIPPGDDDTAAVRYNGSQLVITTDIMFAPSHFPKGMEPEAIGRKIAVANISDLAAMGAEPLALLVAFGLPPSLEFEFVRRISSGIDSACMEHGCAYAGGDTKRSEILTLCGSALGVCGSEKELLKRSNARPGDLLCVTGNIGDAYCGCQILLGKAEKIKGAIGERLIRAFTHPKARIREGRALAQLSCEIAAIDITDGLFFSALELMRASGCGFRMDSAMLPFSADAKKYAHLMQHASPVRLLEWGEDYELLVSLRKSDFPKARKAVESAGGRLIQIGEAIREKKVYLDDELVDVRGYDAFRQ